MYSNIICDELVLFKNCLLHVYCIPVQHIYLCKYEIRCIFKKIAKLYQWRTKDLSVAHCADYLWRTVQITCGAPAGAPLIMWHECVQLCAPTAYQWRTRISYQWRTG